MVRRWTKLKTKSKTCRLGRTDLARQRGRWRQTSNDKLIVSRQLTEERRRKLTDLFIHRTNSYSVSKKNPPLRFSDIFPKQLRIFKQIFTHLYAFLCTLEYKFLFNYLQLWRSYAIVCETTQRFFYISLELNFWVCSRSKWRHWWLVISSMFVDIIKAADLGWLATDNDQQSYQRLSPTSERARFDRSWTFWAYYVN